MCCFAGPVNHVAGTKIFARRVAPRRQALVYEMMFSSDADTAMILPLPVPAASPEDAVEFLSFEAYPRFFDDVDRLFPQTDSLIGGAISRGAPTAASAKLAVHEVGSFEASFIPTLSDFSRVDKRFRMPDGVWESLPEYADYGFTVFKLKAGQDQHVHPMVFTFPLREGLRLFFPTLHIHDGEVAGRAHFDHALYCQIDGKPGADLDPEGPRWELSPTEAKIEVDIAKAHNVVAPDMLVYKSEIVGMRDNDDVELYE